MGSFIFIAIFGVLLLAGLVVWVRQREAVQATPNQRDWLQQLDISDTDDERSAVLVSTEHGQLVHANGLARQWLNLNGGTPDLQDIEQLAKPSDNFLSLLTGEHQSAFQLGKRWVEASSYALPAPEGRRMVLVMQEMQQQQSANGNNSAPAQVMDVSKTMHIIDEIGETVDASMGMELALQVLLEIINKALPSDAGEICLWNDERDLLEQRGWIGDTRYLLAVAANGGGYQMGDGVAGWMAQHDKPILINGDDAVSASRMMKENPYTSAIGVPLTLNSTFVGTLTMFNESERAYSPGSISLLQAVSKAVAMAIRNAQLYTTQEERIKDIASLQQIAEQPKGDREAAPIYEMLNERIANLMTADMCGVFLYDDESRTLLPQLPFYGLVNGVAEKIEIPLSQGSPQRDIWVNQPYWVSNDVDDEPLVEALGLQGIVDVAGIRNTALFPMQIAGERIGIIAVSNKQGDSGFLPNDIQNLRVLSSQAAIVVENVRLYQREQRIDTELVGLQEMTHAIGALTHESEFYAEISERIARLMTSEMCGVLIYDKQQQALVSQLPFYGIPDELVENYVIDLPNGSIMQQLWEEDDYWYSNRVPNDPLVFEAGLDNLASAANVTNTLMAVMSAGGQGIGVVQVSNKENNADYDTRDARLLQIFATQAGAIIENARLYREVQMRANQAERLRRVAELSSTVMTTEETFKPVLEEVARLTDSEMVYINVVDQNNSALVTYPRWTYGIDLDDPVIQDLNAPGYHMIPARSGQNFRTGDTFDDERVLGGYLKIAKQFDIVSSLIVPLQVGDRIIGELGIGHSQRNVYSQNEESTLNTVAAQIASAVERLLLYEATGENLRRRVEELDAIARVSNELTLTVELGKVLEVIRDEAVKATNADNATVVLLKPNDEWRYPNQPEMDRRIGGAASLTDLTDIEEEAVSRGADPFFIQDYAESELAPAPANSRSAAAAAILYLDEIVGVIHAYHSDANAFDERAAGFLMTLSTKASLAYQNALLYQQQKERGERLRQRVDQLNRIFELGQMQTTHTDPRMVLEAIAYSVQQSVGYDTVLMLQHDDANGRIERVAHAGMPLDKFQETRERTISREQLDVLLQDDYRISESYFFPINEVEEWYEPGLNVLSTSFEDNRSVEARSKNHWHDGDMLVVPVTGQGGNLLGLMSLDRPYDNLRPDRSNIEVLEIFAHQASTMMESSRLFMESQRSAEQEAKLNELLERVASTLELDELAAELAEGIHELIPFRRMTLVLTSEQDDASYEYLRATYDDDEMFTVEQSQRNVLGRTLIKETFETEEEQFYTTDDDDTVRHYDDLRSWYDQGDRSGAVLPLTAGGNTLGVLHIGSEQDDALANADNRRLLTRIAQLVASSVQNARLFNQAVNLQILNRSVVESIQQGIVVLDNSGRILSVNEFMRQTYGWDDSARNRDLFEYQPDLSLYLKDDIRAVLEEGEPRELVGQTSPDETNERVVRNFYIYPLRSRDKVRGAVLLVEDVTERTRLEEAIETRANQLAALTEVSTRITASLEREEVVELAMEEMGWIIPFTTMSMWRRNGSFMALEGASGFDTNLDDADARVRISDEESITQLVDSQRVVSMMGDDELPDLGLPHDVPIRSWMGVPLVNQGHVVGMIILTKDTTDSYDTRQEHHVAFAFASQVAIALANADLFEQTFERTNELGTLLEAAQQTSLTRDVNEVFRTVAELMFSSLEMEDCVILIWEEFDNELEVHFSGNRMGDASHLIKEGTRYNIDDYPAREKALKSREVVVIIDTDDEDRLPPYPYELEEMRQHNAGARMMVPLVVRDEAIGLIQLEQTSNNEDSITQQKVRLARALGSQVAVSIENARLTTQTSQRFEELLTINQLSQSISSTLQLEDMIPIIRNNVPEITSAEELYLALYHPEDERITFPLAVREGEGEFVIPSRELGNDEVSYIIKRGHSLNLGADYFSIDELRRSMSLTNGEGDVENYMGVPLKGGSQVLGVLAIRNVTRKKSFNINDDRILSTVGSQLGAAIQNARLYEQVTESAERMERLVNKRTEELEEERDRLDTLYQITAELAQTLDMEQLLDRSLGMISKAVGAHDGVILTTDPATDALYCRAWLNPNNLLTDPAEDEVQVHPAEGLANWLLRYDESNDNVALITDLNEEEYWGEEGRKTELRSAMAVLLENNEDPLGVMVLLSYEPQGFTESHLKLLVPAATQMAASMNSADLYQLIRDQAERMSKLLRAEQEEAEKNQAILESIADGVLLANAENEIVLFNSAAERILEMPREQALGQSVNKLAGIYGQSAVRWTNLMTEWADQADRPELADETVDDRIQLGDKIIDVQLSPVFSGDWFLGTVSVFRDVTADVEADRAKSQFIANVSHEFRTPLTSIKGYTDLLLMNATGDLAESQLKFVQTIKENSERLTALVEDVLNISKLDSGEDAMTVAQVDLHELVPHVFQQIATIDDNINRDLDTSVTVADDVPIIEGDRAKLAEMLTNIIDNAFNYTQAGGSINVAVRRNTDNDSQVMITIEDTGVGIPQGFQEAAWRRFERHDETAVELDVAGTGLGLSLAREFVKLHGGDIWFDSEEGVGTVFYIRLPIEQPRYRSAALNLPTIDNETIAGD